MNTFSIRRKQPIENFEMWPLFTWPPGKSDTLSQLILDMKSAPAFVWQEYAKSFVSLWPESMLAQGILISHPSRSDRKHAYYWGEGLSHLLNRPHVEGLKLKGAHGKQQELSSQHRRLRDMEKVVDFSGPNQGSFIFVDDIVTTGNTAMAAYKALGQPRDFQVWCLAYRPMSSIAAR